MFKIKMGKKGFSLVENLIGVLLLGILITGIFGVYYVSAVSISRGNHMAVANRVLRSYMAQELAARYLGGNHDSDVLDAEGHVDETIDGSYYKTMPKSKNGSATETLNGVTYTITCDPWYPNNIQTASGSPLMFDGVRYKIVGFKVSWIDKTPVGRQDVTLSVKSAVIICEH